MSVSFENKETNRGVLTFTISQDQIKPELDRVFNSVKKTLNVPGFRKGHLPRPIFDQKFGEEALYQDALNALLPDAYEAAVKEAGLEVVAQPKIDVTSMEKGQDWVITAEVVTKPEVKLGEYKNLEVSVDVDKEVTDADVEGRIERERNNLAELVIKEGAAENGDTVVIDFVGSIDGVEFDGGKGENFSLGLGSGQFIPGFEDQLVGHSAGETVDVIVTFPEDYQAEDLAGKEATMRVENVFSLMFVSIGNAVSPYVSQNLGANKTSRIKKGYRAALLLDTCFAALAFIVIETLHTQISSLFLGKDGTALAYQVSGDYMRWLGYFFIFMGIKMATDGVLRGLGIMRPFLIANMVNLAIRLSVALIFAPRFGIAFVWLAVPAGWLANFLISYAALRKSWPTDETERAVS